MVSYTSSFDLNREYRPTTGISASMQSWHSVGELGAGIDFLSYSVQTSKKRCSDTAADSIFWAQYINFNMIFKRYAYEESQSCI